MSQQLENMIRLLQEAVDAMETETWRVKSSQTDCGIDEHVLWQLAATYAIYAAKEE